MNWSTTVLSTLSSDTQPSLILDFTNAKYIFNLGEGSSRAISQSGRTWKRTKAILFTGLGVRTNGGLVGTLMSTADSNLDRINIVGLPGLTHWIAAMRLFTFRKTCAMIPTEIPIDHEYEFEDDDKPMAILQDENATIYGFPIFHQDHSPSPKRKRPHSPSPPSASKRGPRSKTPEIPRDEKETIFTSPTLAHEWRTHIIRAMFPNTHDAKSEGLRIEARNRKMKGLPARPTPSPKKPDMLTRDDGTRAEIVKSKRAKKFTGSVTPGERKSDDMILSRGGSGGDGGPSALVDITSTSSETSSKFGKDVASETDEFKRSLPSSFFSQLPPYTHPTLHPSDPSKRPTIAYITLGPRYRGKFNAAKAKELKIPNGNIRSQLTKGESVTFSVVVDETTGETVERTVKSEEVMGESSVPAVVIILDIPTPSHIPSVIKTFTQSSFYSKFHKRHAEYANDHIVRSVYHLCGEGVLDDPRYVEFMNGFGGDAWHLFSAPEYLPDKVTYIGAAYNTLMMNRLDSEMFPLPKCTLKPRKNYKDIPNLPIQTMPIETNTVESMRPPKPPQQDLDHFREDLFHPHLEGGAPLELSERLQERFNDAWDGIKKKEQEQEQHDDGGKDLVVTTLGTGSAVPGMHRNVMSNLLYIPNFGYILLDCGEGTWGQILRSFGVEKARDVLGEIKCIFASHLHADHHTGLVRVLSERRRLSTPPKDPLYLITLRKVHLNLREISSIEDIGFSLSPSLSISTYDVIPILSEAIHFKKRTSYQPTGVWSVPKFKGEECWVGMERSKMARDSLLSLSSRGGEEGKKEPVLTRIETVDVRHRSVAYGLIIEGIDKDGKGWSVVWSGDTTPTSTLALATTSTPAPTTPKRPTLLIHEATLSDDQEIIATSKGHSTFGQAIGIGKDMNVRNVLLTHFSARYPKMPPLLLDSGNTSDSSSPPPPPGVVVHDGKKNPTISLAYDLARFRVGDMWKMGYYMSSGALEEVYVEGDVVGEGEEEERMVELDQGG